MFMTKMDISRIKNNKPTVQKYKRDGSSNPHDVVYLIFTIFVLSNCEIKVREAKAQSGSFNSTYNKETVIIENMEYVFLYVKNQSSQTGYGVTVINITKDKLEIELLRKQLADTIK